MKKALPRIILLILPLVFLISGMKFERAKFAGDPEYIYLMNALNLVQGKAVGHIDNPGTTVMEFSAGMLFVFPLFDFSKEAGIVQSVLEDPDRFVGLLQSAFVVLNMLGFILIGFVVFRKTQNIWYALLFQITPFFSVNLLEHAWTKVSPEPMLLFATTLLAMIIVLFYYDKNRRSWWYVLWFSLIMGFGLATKATWLPLLIIPLILLPGFIRKLAYIPGFVASFVLFTSPAIPEYKYMFKWFYGLSTHTGVYGQGEKGFIDFDVYFTSIISIFQNNPVMTAIFLFAGITILMILIIKGFREISLKSTEFRILLALVLAIGGGILVVAKHYHSNHYLLPELALSGVTLFFVLFTWKKLAASNVIDRYLIPLIVLASIIVIPLLHIPVMKEKSSLYQLTNQEQHTVDQLIETRFPEYTPVYFYPGPLNKVSALKFGNVYTKKKNTVIIKEVYPEVLFYDYRNQKFYNWEAETILEEIIRNHGHRLIMVGGPRTGDAIRAMDNVGFPLKTIHNDRTQALHVFDTTRKYYPDSLLNMTPVYVKQFDMETMDEETGNLLLEGVSYGKGHIQTDQFSRSGTKSVRLDRDNRFGLQLKMDSLHPGERYLVSVWRYSDHNESHLVVSAKDSGKFYRSTKDFITTDQEGWKKLSLYFDIPDNFTDGSLVVYLWNTGKTEVYFDDLSVSRLR